MEFWRSIPRTLAALGAVVLSLSSADALAQDTPQRGGTMADRRILQSCSIDRQR
jgi:hypothetical protein